MKCEREKVRGRGSERKETQFPEVAERLLGSCDLPNYSATVTAAVEDGNTPYRRYKSPARTHTESCSAPKTNADPLRLPSHKHSCSTREVLLGFGHQTDRKSSSE